MRHRIRHWPPCLGGHLALGNVGDDDLELRRTPASIDPKQRQLHCACLRHPQRPNYFGSCTRSSYSGSANPLRDRSIGTGGLPLRNGGCFRVISVPRDSRPKPPHRVAAMEPWRRHWIYSSLCGSPSLAVRHHSYRS
jgi:hypothetical protein